ncbi:MAG: MarR family transcriptional regulator [Bacillota bacterium]|nr:MarR family transcriptional regulator [Bacillota bacterium]
MLTMSIGKLISLLFRYFQIYITDELEPFNIGKGQALFLFALYQQDGLSQEKLAYHLNIDKSTTARALDKLEQAGYVTREKNIKDLRSNQIFLTQKAIEFKPRLYSILERWTTILSEGMTEEEIETALKLLTKMFENAIVYIQNDRNKANLCCNDLRIDALEEDLHESTK